MTGHAHHGKHPSEPMGSQRLAILLVSIGMAFIMYLDRICLSEIVKSDLFLEDIVAHIQNPAERKAQIGKALGAFFFTYALLQIPAGWASDRFGARRMLSSYIAIWSLTTAITATVSSLGGLMWARLACGVAQAGAYPASGGLIRRWFPLQQRGIASGWVSFGGRMGGTLAPFLTAFLIFQMSGWRGVLWIYCIIGLLIAALYWHWVRDDPSELAGTQELGGSSLLPSQTPSTWQQDLGTMPRLLLACAMHPSLWLNSLAQMSVNIGWVFLVTWLPTYLKEVHRLPDRRSALLVSCVLAVGMLGQIVGGRLVDKSVSTLGLRWGRSLPGAGACFLACGAYFACSQLGSVWAILACCALVSFFTDVANPSTWSFMQDIGGKHTASVAGWGNMWGNLGASLSSVLIPRLQSWGGPGPSGQNLAFLVFSSAFFIAGCCFLGMNATHPIYLPGEQRSPAEA